MGLVDFYHVSKCMLFERLGGAAPAPSWAPAAFANVSRYVEEYCRCAADGRTLQSGGGADVRWQHHKEGHRSTMTGLDATLLRKMDALTRVDAALLRLALPIFLGEAAALERRLGRKVLCDEFLAMGSAYDQYR